jgi:hypothetical protein
VYFFDGVSVTVTGAQWLAGTWLVEFYSPAWLFSTAENNGICSYSMSFYTISISPLLAIVILRIVNCESGGFMKMIFHAMAVINR